MTKTFTERCHIAQQSLPDAQYKAMLTALHADMLAKLAEQPAHTATYTCGACGVSMRMEQPAPAAQQKPVAWMQDSIELYVQDRPGASYTIPLYTTPQAQPSREPLTLREIGAVCGNFSDEIVKVVRQTEAAHNIKENT